MLLSGEVLVPLLIMLSLIGINTFFAAAEFSIVSVRRSRISQLIAEGNIKAKRVRRLQSRLEQLLSATQLGITFASLTLGWLGEDLVSHLIRPSLTRLPFSDASSGILSHSIALLTTFVFIAYFQIVLGELLPKSIALSRADDIARLVAGPILAIARVFSPLIWILNQSNRLILRLLGVPPIQQGLLGDRLTPEELQLIISTERESMGLEAEERELLSKMFDFGDVTAEEIMTPRTKIHALSENATLKDVLDKVSQTNHSAFPIYGESFDEILGFIRLRDLAEPLKTGNTPMNTSIARWMKTIAFEAEDILIPDLLAKMQRTKRPMYMIRDEFGGTAGLVTFKDILNEIIGDQLDHERPPSYSIQMVAPQTYIADAQLDLEEFNKFFDIHLPELEAEDYPYQTLGGFLLYHWQKIPEAGAVYSIDDLEFQLVDVDGPLLKQIKIIRQASEIETLTSPTMLESESIEEAKESGESDYLDDSSSRELG